MYTIHKQKQMKTYAYIVICIYTYTHVNVYMYIHTPSDMHIYIHTHLQTKWGEGTPENSACRHAHTYYKAYIHIICTYTYTGRRNGEKGNLKTATMNKASEKKEQVFFGKKDGESGRDGRKGKGVFSAWIGEPRPLDHYRINVNHN